MTATNLYFFIFSHMTKITPFLWYDKQALEAARFYTSIFPNSSIHGEEQFENSGPDEDQTVQIVSFELNGLEMQAMNAGPLFKFNPSISFFVKCASREEVDTYYNKLMEGGSALMPLGKYDWSEHFGWVTDRYGLTWQIMLHDQWPIAQNITPCLLFTKDHFGKAGKALNLYTSLFQNSSIDTLQKYPTGEFEGKILFAECTLDGSRLILMDGPGTHEFAFNEAVSLMVDCADQAEVDHFWNGLIADTGAESQCGWLFDIAGVSWQIVPRALGECFARDTSGNVMKAMLGMKKLIVSELEAAVR
jgi:predicted 3-demethylubiquinone-9 3-methyltransferase (glyoxalase superfamily)